MNRNTLLSLFAAAASLAAQTLTILPGSAPVPVPGGINHEVLVQNTGSAPIPGPVGILVNKLDTRAYVENRANIVRSPLGGLAYLMVVDAGPDNVLSPGETGRTTIRTRGESLVFTSSQGPYQLTSVQYPYKVTSQNGALSLTVYTSSQGPYQLTACGSNSYVDNDCDGTWYINSFNVNTGTWRVRTNSGTLTIPAFADPMAFNQAIAAPFHGGNTADLAVFNKTTGQWAIRDSRTGAVTIQDTPNYNSLNPATSKLHLVPADYDGDGIADIAIFNQTTAQFRLRSSRTSSDINITLGTPGATVPVGSYRDADGDTYGLDGLDGIGDVCDLYNFAAYDRATGRLLTYSTLKNTIKTKVLNLAWEADDDQVAAGDVDNDGISDLIVSHVASRRYTIRYGATGQTSYTGLELIPAAQILGSQMTFQQWANATALHGDDDSDVLTQIGRATLSLKQSIVSASYAANATERIVSTRARVR